MGTTAKNTTAKNTPTTTADTSISSVATVAATSTGTAAPNKKKNFTSINGFAALAGGDDDDSDGDTSDDGPTGFDSEVVSVGDALPSPRDSDDVDSDNSAVSEASSS